MPSIKQSRMALTTGTSGAYDWHQWRSRQASVAPTTGTQAPTTGTQALTTGMGGASYSPSYWSGFSTNPLYLSSSPLITAS